MFCKLPTNTRSDNQTPRTNTATYNSTETSKGLSFPNSPFEGFPFFFFFWKREEKKLPLHKIQEVLINKVIITAFPELIGNNQTVAMHG